ncbi:MAG: hypothetical protein AAFX87_24710 [Bacteroidota bacterium]
MNINNIRLSSLFFIVVLIVFSCSSTKSSNQSGETNGKAKVADQTTIQEEKNLKTEQAKPIPPEFCRLTAQVISIHPVKSNLPDRDPCSKLPCGATIKIKEVIGYGSSFSGTLSPEQEIKVNFAFTLSNSKEAFPNKSVVELPGLGIGDSFMADVEGSPLLGGDGKYKIYQYIKQ